MALPEVWEVILFQVRGVEVGGDPSYCIAELGNNHGGSLDTAHELIEQAAWAGADACKTQIRTNDELYTKSFLQRPYDSENAYGPTYGAHRAFLELTPSAHRELKDHAESLGMAYFATVFDFSALDLAVELGLPALKIASGSLTNTPLIAQAARTELPLIISTGGAHISDVKRAVETVRALRASEPKYALLQATAAYPCPAELLDLGVIHNYKTLLFRDCVPGLSSHYSGIIDGPIAYMLGARVFEKHLSLDRASKGTDHAFSLEPKGFKKFVRDLRRTEVMVGDGLKRRHVSEADPITKMSCSLYAARALKAGDVIEPKDIAIKSPAAYIAPYELPKLVGCELLKDMRVDDAFEWEVVANLAEDKLRTH